METPKEKAIELIDKFRKIRNYNSYATPLSKATIKQCALIAVDEIIKAKPCKFDGYEYNSTFNYWTEVKQEIEKR